MPNSLSGLPILSWGWKVSNVVRSAIETKKDRFDAAARVMIVFGKELIGVLAIGIQTNTDHGNERVTAYYSEPILKKR